MCQDTTPPKVPFSPYDIVNCNAQCYCQQRKEKKKTIPIVPPGFNTKNNRKSQSLPSQFPNIVQVLTCGAWCAPWREGWNGCWKPVLHTHHKERAVCATTHKCVSGEVRDIRFQLRIEEMSGPVSSGPSAQRRGMDISELVISPQKRRRWGQNDWATATLQRKIESQRR